MRDGPWEWTRRSRVHALPLPQMSRVFRATDETSHSRSTRVDRIRRNHSQRGDARDEKIVSATQLHKIRQVRAYVRRIAGIHGSLNHELSSACVIPDEHILVVSL